MYLSRGMRMVQLARQQNAELSPNIHPVPLEPHQRVTCSTPNASPENLAETSLDDIPYTDLVPFNDQNNDLELIPSQISANENIVSTFPPKSSRKSCILTHGNVMTNVSLNLDESNVSPFDNENSEVVNNCRSSIEETLAVDVATENQNAGTSTDQHVSESVDCDTAELSTDASVIGSNGNAGPREADENQEGNKQKKRKKADPSKSIKVVNKIKRARGEAYMGRKYDRDTGKYEIVEKPAKELGERCSCKTVGTKCSELTEETRGKIHKEVWSMSWPQKEVFVKSMVHRNEIGRHRVDLAESSRQNTLKYFLLQQSLLLVCKKMFINTCGITQHFIRTHVLGGDKGIGSETSNNTITVTPKREEVKQFLASLDTVPSHYCRKNSSKKYFTRDFDNKMDVYREYKEWCSKNETRPASRQILCDEIDIGNYGIFHPRKDQCDLCFSHDEGNMDDEEAYILHRRREKEARAAKDTDKALAAGSNGNILMITINMQAVLLAPALRASALYYRTKLCVHNFTIFNTTNKDALCYVWHEVEGGLTANEFASCLCDYIAKNITAACKDVIIYSDGCTYQNRNSTQSKALTYTAQTLNITITHKYLEKGHTQMEVDSVHKTIEDKIKNKSIYSPSDYVRYMREARQNPGPYKVEYLDHTFFRNYNNVCGVNNIRPGKKKGDPQVVDIRCLKYTPDGRILYKLLHEGEWEELFVRGNSTRIVGEPTPLLQGQRPLSLVKWKHLQEMKPVIPRDLHSFYDSLPHS